MEPFFEKEVASLTVGKSIVTVRLVQWTERAPVKVDIRNFEYEVDKNDHSKTVLTPKKGIALSKQAALTVYSALKKLKLAGELTDADAGKKSVEK